jgi:ABC-type nitrate/sulfonate/bicarbonate transport system permease component
MKTKRVLLVLEHVFGWSLLIIVWLFLCYVVAIPERYLPRPGAVFGALWDIDPPLYVHIAATTARILIGTIAGTALGIALALFLSSFENVRRMLMPAILALRAVPLIATVPFFLLWFGFSEWGKFLLVAIGVGLNIVVASLQILEETNERYLVALASLKTSLRSHPVAISLPLIAQSILPTLRTSVAIIFGAVLVSELLGSQLGLGYLIQTSRTTYSMHVVFLVTAILGVLASLVDWTLIQIWKRCVFWMARSARGAARSLHSGQ